MTGDPDWGKIHLDNTEIGHSPVKYIDTGTKLITINQNIYGTGTGVFVVYIRGQNTSFEQDAVSPSWELYTNPIEKTWQFFQFKLVGASVGTNEDDDVGINFSKSQTCYGYTSKDNIYTSKGQYSSKSNIYKHKPCRII